MIKETVTYEDYDGNTITEDFWFHLSKVELTELELSAEGGSFKDQLQKIIDTKDGKQLFAAYRKIISAAVGKRLDNKTFVKPEEFRDSFMNSDAYSELFMQLFTETNRAVRFINGVVPASMRSDEKQLQDAVNGVNVVDGTVELAQAPSSVEPTPTEQPKWLQEMREPTQDELRLMSQDELRQAFMLKGEGKLKSN